MLMQDIAADRVVVVDLALGGLPERPRLHVAGDPEAVLPHARALAAVDPLDEETRAGRIFTPAVQDTAVVPNSVYADPAENGMQNRTAKRPTSEAMSGPMPGRALIARPAAALPIASPIMDRPTRSPISPYTCPNADWNAKSEAM